MSRRDGIELTSEYTATVNDDMQVGALTETITVTGESPLVDTRNVQRALEADKGRPSRPEGHPLGLVGKPGERGQGSR